MCKELKVSLFSRLSEYKSEETTLEEIVTRIREGYWKHPVGAYREALQTKGKDGSQEVKRSLPGFTPSGVFQGGHRDNQIVTYNQVIGLDFDDVKNLAALIALFRSMPTTLALFISPGGHGLKVFVPVDCGAEHHRRAFEVVALHYEGAAGIASDRKCRNIGRCCFVSDDPEAYYNPDAGAFFVAVTMPVTPPSLSGSKPADAFVDWFLSHTPLIEGSRNQTLYNLGCEANRRGFAESEIARICSSLLQGSSFSRQEVEQALHSAYQSHTEEYGTKEQTSGHEVDNVAPPTNHFAHPSGKEPKEEGEELRKLTPYFPDDLYENLPPILSEAVSYYTDRRERDMGVLAACTVVGGCLPGVFGFYRRKKVSPHTLTVEVAPAANGKGCIDDMRHLSDHYATLIKTESEREEQEYLQALEEWELKKAEARNKRQPVQVKDAPKPTRARYLVVSSQLTKAKLLVHLRDNGEAGLLIIDSEIDTLVTATKQDYGQFDDILRKAFHHEPVSSSRKTDNEMIQIEQPSIALLLAGTPGQFSRLIPDAESGLMSRLLLYTCRSRAAWQDVSPNAGGADFVKHIASLSARVMEMAVRLRKKNLQVGLTDSQWCLLNRRFSHLLREADLFGSEEFLSVVKRYGLITFRLCMIFTALDVAAESDYIPGLRICSDKHFEAALTITLTCLEHSRFLMTQLRTVGDQPELCIPLKFRDIYDALPAQFTSQEIYVLAAADGISERAVRRFINRATPLYINKKRKGVFLKVTPAAK